MTPPLNTKIEDAPLRGVSISTLRAIIIGTATTVGSILFSYYGIKSVIQKVMYESETADKIFDVRIKAVELQIETIKLDINSLRNRVDINSDNIKVVEKKIN